MKASQPGVPLAHYLDDHPDVDVSLSCSTCGRGRVLPMVGVVQRLKARGLDPRRTGICEIAGLVREACGCGAPKWQTGPHWPVPRMGAAADQLKAERIGEMNDVAASYRAAKGR